MRYEGKFLLEMADGTELEGAGVLTGRVTNGLQSWEGHATFGDLSVASTIDQDNPITVRLPDGRQGEALVQNIEVNAGGGRSAVVDLTLLGNGPMPS